MAHLLVGVHRQRAGPCWQLLVRVHQIRSSLLRMHAHCVQTRLGKHCWPQTQKRRWKEGLISGRYQRVPGSKRAKERLREKRLRLGGTGIQVC